MKAKLPVAALFLCAVLCALVLPGCNRGAAPVTQGVAYGAYETEPDWNDNTKLIKLGYREAHGKRIFYHYCVWCHADTNPVGPSKRSDMSPMPPLMNQGEKLNGESDEYLQNIITLGGSAVGKSPMMPPYGETLSTAEITDVIAFARAIAQPGYRQPGRPGLQTSIKAEIVTTGSLVEGVSFPVSVMGSVQGHSSVSPTGTISFFAGTTQLGSPVPVVAEPELNGAAPSFWNSRPVTIHNAGSYALTVQYSGDSNYAPSTTSTTINVLHHATASISVSPTTVNYGGAVTITGFIDTAIPVSNTALKPTGTVALSGTADGQIKSGVTTTTTADANGNWRIQLSATVMPSNRETFMVTYNSDRNYGTASAFSNLVAVHLPDFSLTANPGSLTITPGQSGSSTITITPLTSMSSTVVLTCSDPLLVNVACTISPASIHLANNASQTATVTLTPLEPSSAGTASALQKRLRATMWISKTVARQLAGSCVCAALLAFLCFKSTSKRSRRVPLGLVASCIVVLAFGCQGGGESDRDNPVPTKVAITKSDTRIPAGNTPSLTLTARVTSLKAVTGTVNFWESGNESALAPPVALANGTATTLVALPSPGTHAIYAQYSGDANNKASQSSTISVVTTGSAHAQIQGTTGPVIHSSSLNVTIQ